ncbi:hypothetical protein Lal_00030119 [Lupinus albus]|nr:hypothetical protein Lal_00030119 [Lupinus albus]
MSFHGFSYFEKRSNIPKTSENLTASTCFLSLKRPIPRLGETPRISNFKTLILSLGRGPLAQARIWQYAPFLRIVTYFKEDKFWRRVLAQASQLSLKRENLAHFKKSDLTLSHKKNADKTILIVSNNKSKKKFISVVLKPFHKNFMNQNRDTNKNLINHNKNWIPPKVHTPRQ